MVDVEVRDCGSPSRSSRESRPSELIVDDLPLRFMCDLVGDEVPLCGERGLNNAVAGEGLVLESSPLPGEAPGGVVTPLLPLEAEATGVCWEEKADVVEDVLWRTGVDGGRDWLGDTPWSWLRCLCRCARGKSGSDCFCFRLRRKKLFVLDELEVLVGV